MPTAFITGGTGFVGLNLIDQLLAESWEVVALHRPTASLKHLREKDIQFVEGSITEPNSLITIFRKKWTQFFMLLATPTCGHDAT